MNEFSIPNYTILRKIGEGGMGKVYLAVDKFLDRQVAIKVLKTDISMQEEGMNRFQSEAIMLARLRHPNITLLYNWVQEHNKWCMIMEYIDGETLETILRQKGPFPIHTAISLITQALDGLQHAHSKGVIHRDIKLSNLMLSSEGEIKIMDFGIARIAGNSRMTRSGLAVGTPEYMSPEQIKGEPGEQASDIYSMGVVLYELLTGQVPFHSENEFTTMKSHLETKPLPPVRINPNIPESLNRIILRALEKDPSKRFPDAAAFKAALKEMAGTVPQSDTEPTKEKTKKHWLPLFKRLSDLKNIPEWKDIKSSTTLAIGFFTVSIITAGIIIISILNSNEPPENLPNEIDPNEWETYTPPTTNTSSTGQTINNIPIEVKETPPDKEKIFSPPVDEKKKVENKERKTVKDKTTTEDKTVTDTPKEVINNVSPPKTETTETNTETIETGKEEKINDEIKTRTVTLDKKVMIPRGTQVSVVLDNDCNDIIHEGARISFTVTEDLVRSNIVVISRGAKAYGYIKRKKTNEIIIEMLEVKSVTGKSLQTLSTNYKASRFRKGEKFKMYLEYDRL